MSNEFRISPSDEIVALLSNSRDLAVRQQITEARDVIRAAQIVAESFSFSDTDIFDRLSEAVISKPFDVVVVEFDNALRTVSDCLGEISSLPASGERTFLRERLENMEHFFNFIDESVFSMLYLLREQYK